MATILSVRDRLKRQVTALERVRLKRATINDITCSAALQAAGKLGARAFDVPIRVSREEHDDIVIVGISVRAGGYEKHTVFVPTTPITNDQYADYLEFRPELGPAEALAMVLEG
jgi:hypothetical protein